MPLSTAPNPSTTTTSLCATQSPIHNPAISSPLRMNGTGLKLDLKLNLSPPRVSHPMLVSPNRSSTTMSSSSSCVSSENQDDGRRYCNSPEAAAVAMVLVGCPRCLMYVMLSDFEPKCPKCKSTVLLNLFYDHKTNNVRRT